MHLPEPCQGFELWKPTSLDKELECSQITLVDSVLMKVMTLASEKLVFIQKKHT